MPQPDDAIENRELLYRAVQNLPQNFPAQPGGTRRISAQVFGDRMMRPSVDRAALRDHDPQNSRFAPSDGVLQLTAGQVRTIGETRNDEKGRPVADYVADVEPVPLPDNPAHAEIFGRPGFDNKSVFRRVCERLAQMATWALLPADLGDP